MKCILGGSFCVRIDNLTESFAVTATQVTQPHSSNICFQFQPYKASLHQQFSVMENPTGILRKLTVWWRAGESQGVCVCQWMFSILFQLCTRDICLLGKANPIWHTERARGEDRVFALSWSFIRVAPQLMIAASNVCAGSKTHANISPRKVRWSWSWVYYHLE